MTTGEPARDSNVTSTPRDAFDGIIATILSNHARIIDEPIIDRCRFPTEVFAPHAPERILEALQRLVDERSQHERAIGQLADDPSVRLYQQVLAFRALGACRFAMPLSTRAYLEQYAEEETYRVRRTAQRGRWPQSLFRIEACGEDIELDVWDGNLAATFLRKQYFLERDGIRVQPEPGDVVIDGGGCIGDTALLFAAAVGPKGKVYSFEPIPSNREFFVDNLSRNPGLSGRIELLPHALSDASDVRMQMADIDAGSRMSEKGGVACLTSSIDTFVRDRCLDRVDFIKLDVEGHEARALQGGAKAIARLKPRLAISAYHLAQDIWSLPILIKSLNPDYEIYLDHYTCHSEETVLYAL